MGGGDKKYDKIRFGGYYMTKRGQNKMGGGGMHIFP